ncbi:MAG: GNAT family N-acetyltransferase [Candidatus Aphodomorpha sp.]
MIGRMEALTLPDFERMEALERACYDAAYIAPAAEAYAWYLLEPRSTVALSEDGRLIGFVNLFPVREAVFRALLSGSFNDSGMTAGDLAPAGAAAKHLFLSCIAVAEPYRGRGVSGRLLRMAAAQYAAAPDAQLVTDNVTAAGRRLSERCGLSFLGESGHGSWIYAGDWHSFVRAIERL